MHIIFIFPRPHVFYILKNYPVVVIIVWFGLIKKTTFLTNWFEFQICIFFGYNLIIIQVSISHLQRQNLYMELITYMKYYSWIDYLKEFCQYSDYCRQASEKYLNGNADEDNQIYVCMYVVVEWRPGCHWHLQKPDDRLNLRADIGHHWIWSSHSYHYSCMILHRTPRYKYLL